MQRDLQGIATHFLSTKGEDARAEESAVRQPGHVCPRPLRLRGAMAQLEHHRQDVALVLLHQLSRGVEPHHHQGEGLAILANL